MNNLKDDFKKMRNLPDDQRDACLIAFGAAMRKQGVIEGFIYGLIGLAICSVVRDFCTHHK